MFKDALGLFWNDRYKPLFEAVLGIGMAIGFSYIWGTLGVILGFTLGTLLSSSWIEPYVLYKYGFNKSFFNFSFLTLKQLFVCFIAFMCTYILCSFVIIEGWTGLILRAVICLIVPNAILLLFYFKTEEFKYIKNLFKDIINKIKFRLSK